VRVFFPVLFSMLTISVLSLVEIFLLRTLHHDWWRRLWVRRLSWGVPATGLLALSVWTLGIVSGIDELIAIGAASAAIILVVGLALMLSLPVSGIMHVLSGLLQRMRRSSDVDAPPNTERRRLLRTSAAVFPLLAVGASAKGIVSGYSAPHIPIIPLHFSTLPARLEGLRILHVTDVHIGFFIGLDDFEQMMEHAAGYAPDVLLITGDFSDDTNTYLDALRIAGELPVRYGRFASIGNHEYFRGIRSILRDYDRGPIPLLLNEGMTLDIDGESLYIAGLDDPRSMRRMPEGFFSSSVDTALRNRPASAFSILMSHRPTAFDVAADVGVQLTLAGHTHGGQLGFNGKSLLYALNPEKYMWGEYRKGEHALYVSAGAGHWFPYRLGCPAEIPLYVLTSASLRYDETESVATVSPQ